MAYQSPPPARIDGTVLRLSTNELIRLAPRRAVIARMEQAVLRDRRRDNT